MINKSAARCIRFIIQCIRQTLELEIWFRFADEIAYSITMKQLVDLSACIFIEIERKKKKKERKTDSISDRLVHIMAILIELLA